MFSIESYPFGSEDYHYVLKFDLRMIIYHVLCGFQLLYETESLL